MNITFAIPTWNRAKLLERCVESIAQQNPHRIVISDNASTDETPDLCEFLSRKYPFVIYKRLESHVTYDLNFKSAVEMAESEYTWMFGDDDLLEPHALQVANKLIELNLDFYHVSEVSRSKTHTIYTGELLDLCFQYGFIEMTGFITANIVKSDKLKKAFNSQYWGIYAKSAFPHSLGILEVLSTSEGALVDIPLIRSPSEATPEALERWKIANTANKYIYVTEGLKTLQSNLILPEKLPETFFRYLQGTLVKRMMENYIARTVNPNPPVSNEEWDCMKDMVWMIDGKRGEDLADWFNRVRYKSLEIEEIINKAVKAAEEINKEASSVMFPLYDYEYVS